MRIHQATLFKVIGTVPVQTGDGLPSGPIVIRAGSQEQRGHFVHDRDLRRAVLELSRPIAVNLSVLGQQALHYKAVLDEPISDLQMGRIQINEDAGVFIPARVIAKLWAGFDNPAVADPTLISGLQILFRGAFTPNVL